MGRLTSALVSTLAFLSSVTTALNQIEIKGQDFIDTTTGKRLVLLGIDYQPGGEAGYKPQTGNDALSDGQVCLRDAAVLQSLGVNTIRVYNIAPEINHDDCMSIFNVAGIYVILDVNAPYAGESLDRTNPSGTYTPSYLNRTFQVVEAFKNFPNTLAFFAGNEVVNDEPSAKDNPPYIRAIQRDLKQYIKQNSQRQIPVGYSAADVRPILADTWNYFRCAINGDSSDDSRSDFFGLNSYSWCGSQNTFQTSTYDQLAAMFQNSNIPVFFSEYGCNKVQPRTFPEVAALYGNQMTMLSGGLVYEYSQEDADFGLVQINGNKSVSLLVDFDNLQKQYNNLDLSLLQSANQSAESLSPPRCSSSSITSGYFSTSFNVPDQPDGITTLIKNGVPGASSIQGKLVDVNNLNSPYAVYSTSGQQLSLSIKAVSSQNAPSGSSTSSNSSSSSSSSGSDKKGAAVRIGGNGAEAMMAMAVAMGVWVFLN